MSEQTTTTDLATTEPQGEIQQSAAMAAAQSEIETAIHSAKRFPRNEDEAFRALMKSCGRPSFAKGSTYGFPRGGKKISGPSIKLAREAARIWGNMRFGLDVIYDDRSRRTVRGWAHDVQTNTRVSSDDTFAKLVQRKDGAGGTNWVEPDERDLRELTNKRGAICVRNCLLQLLPPDLIEDAITQAAKTNRGDVDVNPDEHRKKIILAFSTMNITVDDLEGYLGHELRLTTPDEIVDLREVWQSIKDGNSVWSDYVGGKQDTPPAGDESNLSDEVDKLGKTPTEEFSAEEQALVEYQERIEAVGGSIINTQKIAEDAGADNRLSDVNKAKVVAYCDEKVAKIRASRGSSSKS